MRILGLVGVLVLVSVSAFGQRYATATGNWNAAIWATTPGGVAGSAATPTATDDVYTNGRLVVVTASTSCRNLFVSYDVASSITINALRTLTITGTLTGYNDGATAEEFPITSVIVFSNLTSSIINFTGANMTATYTPYIIYGWDAAAPLGKTNFTLGAATFKILSSLAFNGAVTVASGTLVADPGVTLSGPSATFTVNSGATFTTDDPFGSFSTITCSGTFTTTNTMSATNLTINSGGNLSSSLSITLTGNLTVNSGGTIGTSGSIAAANTTLGGTINTSNFLNTTTNFTLNSTGVLNTSFTGGTQTQAWWSNSNSPGGSLTMDPAGTVNFSSSSSQNVFAQPYGNLILGGANTKTVVGAGTLAIGGSLTVSSASVTLNSDAALSISISGNLSNAGIWSPTDLITFNGTGAQSIQGSSPVTFTGGITVNKLAETLTLNQSATVVGGLTIIAGTINLGTQSLTVSSGNISNSGTFSPGTASTVTINGITAITGANPVNFHNLTVGGSGNLTATGTVNVAGNLSNSGTFSISSINFSGTAAQNIAGTLALSDITVSNASGVNNNGTINLTSALTMSGSGVFDADGSGAGILRLRSTGLTTTARIATLPNPSLFTGNVTVERFVNAPEGWRYISMPVLNGNVGMWQDNFPVTGNFSNPSSGGNVISSSAPSIYFFNAATQTWTAVGAGASTSATALSNTVGYSAWTYLSSDVSVDVRGDIGKGNKALSLLTGSNLIPNPFPSAIDWDFVNLAGVNLVTNSIYVRTANNTFATYLQGAGTGTGHPLGGSWGGEIALGQSFWVNAVGSTTLTLQESNKTSSTYFVRESTPADYMKIRLNKDAIYDEVMIHFKQGATLGTDVEFDALKRTNEVNLNISLYNTDPNIQYAINGLPFLQCTSTTKIRLGDTNPTGQYALSFSDLISFSTGYEVTLIDNFLGTEKGIVEGMNYPFQITSDPASGKATRFELKFSSPVIDQFRDLTIDNINECKGTYVKVAIGNSQAGVDYQFMLSGVGVNQPIKGTGETVYAYVLKSQLQFGINKLSLMAVSGTGCQAYEYTNAFDLRYDAIPEITSVQGSSVCDGGSVVLAAQGAPEGGYYRWYESESSVAPIDGVMTAEYATPLLSETRMYYVTTVNASGCESTVRVPVQATVTKLIAPTVSINGDVLTAPASLGTYQWYRDGQPVSGAQSNTLNVVQSGTYFLRISNAGCSIDSEGVVFIINANEEGVKGDMRYSVYPNPTQDFVRLTGSGLKESKVAFFTNTGKEITLKSTWTSNSHDGNDALEIDFSNVKKGLYLLTIQEGKRVDLLRIIKK